MAIRSRDHYTGCIWGIAALLLVGSVPLDAQAQLKGTIRDPTETPVANVTVTLLSVEHGFQTVSSADGSFHFDDISPDDYDLEIAAAGFAKQKFSVDLRRNPVPASLDIAVKIDDIGSCGQDFGVGYRPLDAAHSHVVGLIKKYDHGETVSHAHISLKPAGAREWIFESRSDKKGEFRFGEIPAGRYDVRISGDGYEVFELKGLMAPRASALYIKASLLRRGEIIICQ